MPNYDIVFNKGAPLVLKNTGCFSELSQLRSCYEYRYTGKESDKLLLSNNPKDKGRALVKKIVYHITYRNMKPSQFGNATPLTDEDVNTYLSYLLNHKVWGKYILNKSVRGVRRYGAIVSVNMHGEMLLPILSTFRYIDEYPALVKTFNFLVNKRGVSPDVAFMVAHAYRFGKGKWWWSACNGHSFLNGITTFGEMQAYVQHFNFPPISDAKYNDTHMAIGGDNWCRQFAGGTPIKKMKGGGGTGFAVKLISPLTSEDVYKLIDKLEDGVWL